MSARSALPSCSGSRFLRLGAGRYVTETCARFPHKSQSSRAVLHASDRVRPPGIPGSLRRGDEQAYRTLIRRFHGSLIGVAASIIGSRAQAEEVVQDAWLAVFAGVDGFEGRSSLVTWVFSIVLNRARTRATREGRLVGLPALMEGTQPGGRAVDAVGIQAGRPLVESSRACGTN